MSRCSSCRAEIEWALTESHKRMPIDVGTRTDGNLVVIGTVGAADVGVTPVVKYVKAGEGDRVSHFATCLNGPAHRRGRG